MKNIQLAIDGIAEDKDFAELGGHEQRVIKRKKLAELIRAKLQTNKVGFARMLCVQPSTVTKWLYSTMEPSMETIKRIARKIGLSVDEVIDLFTVEE